MKKLFKTKIRIRLFFLILISLIGTLWQWNMQKIELTRYTPIGTYINVGIFNAHCYTKGEGNIVFVFIAGSGTPCAFTDFYCLQNVLSAYGKTISFDHAGLGWSSEADHKQDIDNLAENLSVILDSMTLKDNKIILISHSLGALEAIRFTQKHQKRVAGIVFLDGGSPEFYKSDSEILSITLNRSCAILRIPGINRLLGECGVLLPWYGENIRYKRLPKAIQKIDKAMYYKYMGADVNLNNIKQINENAKIVIDGGSISKTPILVLSSDSGDKWIDVQKQLAGWSENSSQITLKNAQHYLHWSNTDEVIHNILLFLKNQNIPASKI